MEDALCKNEHKRPEKAAPAPRGFMLRTDVRALERGGAEGAEEDYDMQLSWTEQQVCTGILMCLMARLHADISLPVILSMAM